MNTPVFRNNLSDFLTLAYPERQFIAFPRNQVGSPLTLLEKIIISVLFCIFMFSVIYAIIFVPGMLLFVLFIAIINFGVNASLQANLKALNLQIGRKVENHQKTVWLIEGTLTIYVAEGFYIF